MNLIPQIAKIVSIGSFAWYGVSCFSSRRMNVEFERYRVPKLRRLTGSLQIAGALGIIAGHWSRPLLMLSAAALAAMMLFAVFTRVRIRDPLYAALPAFSLALLNIYIVVMALMTRSGSR